MVSRLLLPTLFLSHGGGPGFFMKVDKRHPFAEISQDSVAHKALVAVGNNKVAYGLPEKPNAIVIISAHWEERDGFHVYSVERPKLIYDYYGFPPSTYELKYDAPGDPALANRVVDLINSGSTTMKAKIDDRRGGFDHGVFLPLMILYPEASIPIVQVSLHSGLDPIEHIRLGEALAPLRAENILIVGSGEATHPMAPGGSAQATEQFVALMNSILANPSLSRADRLQAIPQIWKSKLLSQTHIPTSEHLTPLAVTAGAAHGSVGRDLFKLDKDIRFMGGLFSFACYVFEEPSEACDA